MLYQILCNWYKKIFLFEPVPPESPFQVRPEIESGLCGLVIPDVLCGDTDSVYRVFQKRMETIFSRNRRNIQSQGSIVLGTEKDFLAPVPDNIPLQAGSGFRAVVGSYAFKFDKRDEAFLFTVIFVVAGFVLYFP